MSDNFTDVGDFHEKFDLHVVRQNQLGKVLTGAHPQYVTADLVEFRRKFLQEELDEFVEGVEEGNDAKMFDALIDLVYVALGTAHLLGYPWQEGWDLVQAANMAKQRAARDGSDSARGSAWDVVKPAGWTAPNIAGLLEKYGFTQS